MFDVCESIQFNSTQIIESPVWQLYAPSHLMLSTFSMLFSRLLPRFPLITIHAPIWKSSWCHLSGFPWIICHPFRAAVGTFDVTLLSDSHL